MTLEGCYSVMEGCKKSITPELNHFITIIIITHIWNNWQLLKKCCHLHYVLKKLSSRGRHCILFCLAWETPIMTSFMKTRCGCSTKQHEQVLSSLEFLRPKFDLKMVTMDQNCIVTLKMNLLRIFCQVISPKFNWTPLIYKLKLSARWKAGHSRFYTGSQGTVGMYGD